MLGEHQKTVFVAARSADGFVGAWAPTTPLPATVYWPRPVVVGNRLYVVGGEFDGPVDPKSVLFADIKDNGLLGNWTNTTQLPVRIDSPGVAVAGNHIIVTGGYDQTTDSARTTTYVGTVDPATGQIAQWKAGPTLPDGRMKHGSAALSP